MGRTRPLAGRGSRGVEKRKIEAGNEEDFLLGRLIRGVDGKGPESQARRVYSDRFELVEVTAADSARKRHPNETARLHERRGRLRS